MFLENLKALKPRKQKKAKMTNTPLITIIVPVYNAKKYLRDCIESILSQTYQNLEIILVDDGSTDGSEKFVDDYAKSDKRIKAIHQKNMGLSGARNTGLKHATGKYVTFVDSDDRIDPNMVEGLLNALVDTHADIAICSFKEIYPNGKTKGFNKNYPKQVFTTESALANMLQENGFMVSATMKLFPTSYFKDIIFPINKLHEDVGTTYKLIMKAKTIVFIPDEYYFYIHHDDSIINQSFDDHKFDLIKLTDQMCDDINQHYPDLQGVTNERRIRARFSILRQIPLSHPKTKEIVDYLKDHQEFITNNKKATKTDKLALKLALVNPKLFQLAYKLFK